MHGGINRPLKNTTQLFFTKLPPPLNPQTVQANLFRQFPPICWFFLNPSLKIGFFSEPLQYQNYSSLTPFHLLKLTKFLVKISQFKFSVTIEKNISVYIFFLLFNISNFSYVLCKNCYTLSPWKNSSPLSQQPHLKV